MPGKQPIAQIDPKTGQVVALPDELPLSSVRWGQEFVSTDMFWLPLKDREDIWKVAERLGNGIDNLVEPLTVFRKTSAMDNAIWIPETYYGSKGTYTGQFSLLENDVIYSANTRTKTAYSLAFAEKNPDIMVPVIWAHEYEIRKVFSHQYSNTDSGLSIVLNWPPEQRQPFIHLPGVR